MYYNVFAKMQNICDLIGWNKVDNFGIFNDYSANIKKMWNARKLGGIYKTFEFILALLTCKCQHSVNQH